MKVKPLTGEIAQSVWNDEDKIVKPKHKDLQDKLFNDDETLIEQVLKEPPFPPKKKRKNRLKWVKLLNYTILINLKMTIFSLKY